MGSSILSWRRDRTSFALASSQRQGVVYAGRCVTYQCFLKYAAQGHVAACMIQAWTDRLDFSEIHHSIANCAFGKVIK